MANFNESKLAKIMARAIIAPEDRASYLPLATPIYCPNNMGVRANRVTIIRPEPTIASVETTTINGQVSTMTNPAFRGVGTNVAKNRTIITVDYVDPSGNKYLTNYFAQGGTYTSTAGQEATFRITAMGNTSAFSFANEFSTSSMSPNGLLASLTSTSLVLQVETGEDISTATQVGDKFRVVFQGSGNGYKVYQIRNDNVIATFDYKSNGTGSSMNNVNGFRATKANVAVEDVSFYRNQDTTSTSYSNTDNTFDITLSHPVQINYTIPYNVDLETEVDLINIIKSDFAVRFKHAISNSIFSALPLVLQNHPEIEITHGDTLAGTIGKLLADNITNGTGNKFSIFKYDNGAPVEYIKTANEPDFDKIILKKEEGCCEFIMSDYACINDVNVPALYYCERPTLLLPTTTFEEYQTALVTGDIRKYVEERINVDVSNESLTDLGEGVFGTNDTFAVAFTEPKVVVTPDKDTFTKTVCITVFYGVELVHTNNLRVIAANEAA